MEGSQAYDLGGNRLSQAVFDGTSTVTTNYAYNLANQITSDGTHTFTYDLNGNLTDDGLNAYTYDAANRLKTFTPDGGSATSYFYNGDGARYRQTTSGVSTDYLLDLTGELTQVLGEFAPGDTIYYLLGLDIIGQQNGSAWSYFGYDGLGSVRQLYDASGNVGYAASYDPYGVPLAQTGSLTSLLGFTGEYTDPSGLIYLRARYMHPALGAFLTRDPFEGVMGQSITRNPYIYAGANPTVNVDPSGKFLIPVALLLFGGAALLVGGVALLVANSNAALPSAQSLTGLVNQCFTSIGLGVERIARGLTRIGDALVVTSEPYPLTPMAVETPSPNVTPAPIITLPPSSGTPAPVVTLTFPITPPVIPSLPPYPGTLPGELQSLTIFTSQGNLPPGPSGNNQPYTKGQLSKAGQAPDKNQHTVAGFSLQKHSTRARAQDWDMLAKALTGDSVPTTASERNRVGQIILDYIINNPSTQWNPNEYAKGRGTAAVAARLPNNLGAWWDKNTGQFIGFLD